MELVDVIDAVESQINRYQAILLLFISFQQATEKLETEAEVPNYFHTLIEDATEYGNHLMIDFCEVKEE